MALSDVIKGFRERFHLSRPKAAQILGVSPGYVRSLELGVDVSTGEPFQPRPSTIEKMAKAMTDFGYPVTVERLAAEAGIAVEGADAPPPDDGHPLGGHVVDMQLAQRPVAAPTVGKSIRLTRGLSAVIRPGAVAVRPYAGRVGCGELLAMEHPEPREIPAWLGARCDFIVEAAGESMTAWRINDGDRLVCAFTTPAQAVRRLVIAHIGDDGAACKLLVKRGDGRYYLESWGRDYHEPIEVDDTARILGVVTWVLPRGFEPLQDTPF